MAQNNFHGNDFFVLQSRTDYKWYPSLYLRFFRNELGNWSLRHETDIKYASIFHYSTSHQEIHELSIIFGDNFQGKCDKIGVSFSPFASAHEFEKLTVNN